MKNLRNRLRITDNGQRTTNYLLALGSATYLLLSANIFAEESALWIAPSEDLVGTGKVECPNGINDWHIRIESDRLNSVKPAAWRVSGGLWYSMVDIGQWRLPYDTAFNWSNPLLKVKQSGRTADLFFDPLWAWPGDVFKVEAILDVNNVLTWYVISNGEGWEPGAIWRGQGSYDNLGDKKKEADGIRDWEIEIKSPLLADSPKRVDVWIPYKPVGSRLTRKACFNEWSSGKSVQRRKAMPADFNWSAEKMTVFINPVLASGGDQFIVRAAMADGSWAQWKVIGLGSNWEPGGKWFGQDNQDFVGANIQKPNGILDWHLQVESPELTSPVRWIVKGAKAVYEHAADGQKLLDSGNHSLYVNSGGTKADLFFEPVMERAGDIFYVTAVLPDGTLLNWGVTSVHQLRSKEVKWLGQTPEIKNDVVFNNTTNSVNQWCIEVKHKNLKSEKPFLWKIQNKNVTWKSPRESDEDIINTRSMIVENYDNSTFLYINPQFVKPGAAFDVQAFFNDGTIVQWTALADGKEWSKAGKWLESGGADFVGHSSKNGPDGKPDWVISVQDYLFYEIPVFIEISGLGWRWQWPPNNNTSPIHAEFSGTSAKLYIAPSPSGKKEKNVLTIKALFPSGNLRFWKAIDPAAK